MAGTFALLLFAAPAQASLDAVTRAASGVTATSAVLNGEVDQSGSPSYYFEYGLTSAYGAKTPAIPYSTRMEVQAVVAGLAPGTTYHFRAVAKRDDRAVRGADQTFTTLASPLTGSGTIIDPLGGLPVVGPDSSGGTGDDDTSKGGTGSSSGSGSGDGTSGDDSSGEGSGGRGGSGDGSGDGGSGDDDSGDGGDSSVSPAETAPVLGSTVGVAPDSGSILVRPPGEDKFTSLDDGAPLPVGSTVDARRGRVRVVTAIGSAGEVQSATFHGAVFQVRQRAAAAGLTDLVLRGGNFRACRQPPGSRASASRASASKASASKASGPKAGASKASGPKASGPKAGTSNPGASKAGAARAVSAARKRRPIRRLWGRDHHGSFRTHGRGAIATVRGTTWAVADYCDGTRTSVSSGAVSVWDKARHRNILVRAGHSYFARTYG